MQLRRALAQHGGSYTKQRYSRRVLITYPLVDVISVIGNDYRYQLSPAGSPRRSAGRLLRNMTKSSANRSDAARHSITNEPTESRKRVESSLGGCVVDCHVTR